MIQLYQRYRMSHNRIYFIIIIFSCTHTVELLTIFQQPRGWIFYGIFIILCPFCISRFLSCIFALWLYFVALLLDNIILFIYFYSFFTTACFRWLYFFKGLCSWLGTQSTPDQIFREAGAILQKMWLQGHYPQGDIKYYLQYISLSILDRPYHKLILNAGNWGWHIQYKVDVWKLKKGNNHILIGNGVFSQLSSSSI